MVEIRLHGRGGQGTITASQILASVFFREGKSVQAFPAFGAERRGAPVAAFVRANDQEIKLRCNIHHPDHLIVLDPTLTKIIDVTSGLKDGAWILINSERDPGHYRFPPRFQVATVDAGSIAVKHGLGTRTFPIVNTAILGAFARVTGLVDLETIVQEVKEAFPDNPQANEAAIREAYREVRL